MSLNKKKVVSLSAESIIGGEPVVRFSAIVTSDEFVNTSYHEQILKTQEYKDNKVEVRADMAAFREMIYELEDSMEAEIAEV